MGLIILPGVTAVDNTDLSASVLAGATTTLRTYTGKGSVRIVQKGNGDVNVTLEYVVDGGAPVSVATGNIQADVDVGFQVSLVIQQVNGDGANAHPSSDVSSTGVYH